MLGGERVDHLSPSARELLANLMHADAITRMRFADAEQAKATGAMIALIPRRDYANQLVVPGGEPVQDLHCTLVSFGESISPDNFPTEELANGCEQLADLCGAIPASVFGHGLFNPQTHDPCGVYLLNDVDNSNRLADIQHEAVGLSRTLVNLPDQHTPWHAHITASYGNPGQIGAFTGDIVFDRLVLSVAGHEISFPLI